MSLLPPELPLSSSSPRNEYCDEDDFASKNPPWLQNKNEGQVEARTSSSVYSVHSSETGDDHSLASSLSSGLSWMDRLKSAEEVHFQMFPELDLRDNDEYTMVTDTTFDEDEILADDESVRSTPPPLLSAYGTLQRSTVSNTIEAFSKNQLELRQEQVGTMKLKPTVADEKLRDAKNSEPEEPVRREVFDSKRAGLERQEQPHHKQQQQLKEQERKEQERKEQKRKEQERKEQERKEQERKKQQWILEQQKQKFQEMENERNQLQQHDRQQESGGEYQSDEKENNVKNTGVDAASAGKDETDTDDGWVDSDEETWGKIREFEKLWKGDDALPCMRYQAAIENSRIEVDDATFNFLRDPRAFGGCLALCFRPVGLSELSLTMKYIRELPPYSLRKLRLSAASLGDDEITCICNALPSFPALEQLWLDSNGPMTAKATGALAEVLPVTRIKFFNIARNAIGADGIVAVARGLRKSRALCTLNFSGNNIGDEGLARLVPILGAAATDAATHRMNVIAIYEAVNPAKVGQVDQLLAKFDGLEKELYDLLEKKYGNLHDLAGVEAAPAPALHALVLGNNGLTAVGAEYLCDICRKNRHITALDICNNAIGDEGVATIVELLKSKNELRQLHLDSNHITERGLSQLLQGTRESPNLTELSLHGNDFGSVAMNWIMSSSDHFYIDEMELSYNENSKKKPVYEPNQERLAGLSFRNLMETRRVERQANEADDVGGAVDAFLSTSTANGSQRALLQHPFPRPPSIVGEVAGLDAELMESATLTKEEDYRETTE